MLRRIYAALMIVFTMFGGTYSPQQSSQPQWYSTTSVKEVNHVSVESENTSVAMISQGEAEQTALEYLNVTRNNVLMERTELDREKGQLVWEIELYHGNTEYEFEVNALTGEIVVKGVEPQDRPDTDMFITPTPEPTAPDNSVTPTTVELTREQALEAVFNDSGLMQDNISRLKIEKDRDDGVYVYEIEIYADNTEYDYTVHAMTGKILEKEIERRNSNTKPAPTTVPTPEPTPTPVVPTEPEVKETSRDEAVAIALEHAGLNPDEVRKLKVEKDRENGVYVYEIEFEKGAFEYEYEIGVSDGKIYKWDKERDD